jgi:hypothetical protein
LYQRVLDEMDDEALRERVMVAEAAIYIRLQELADSTNGDHERKAISQATDRLLKIKLEDLKWPSGGLTPGNGNK